jgi:DNA-directed RNA polymerase specialized sigma24 family protein
MLISRKDLTFAPRLDPVREPDPAAAVLEADSSRLLWKTVSSLEEPCRTLLQLVAADVGYQQVALRLGVPIGSVGPTRTRCLEKLRTLISLQETVQ